MVSPHLFDGDDWPFPSQRQSMGESISILHAGALYWVRRPDILLSGFMQFRRSARRSVSLHLLGSCAPEIAQTLAEFSNEPGVFIQGAVTEAEARSAIKSSDILVIIDVALPRNVHLPSKVADYVGACKPILYIGRPDSPVCRLLAGVHPAFLQANSAEEVSDALARLADLARALPVSAYRKVYESLNARPALAPVMDLIRSSSHAIGLASVERELSSAALTRQS